MTRIQVSFATAVLASTTLACDRGGTDEPGVRQSSVAAPGSRTDDDPPKPPKEDRRDDAEPPRAPGATPSDTHAPREPGHADSVGADGLGDAPRAPGDAAKGDGKALGDAPRMPGTDNGKGVGKLDAPRSPGDQTKGIDGNGGASPGARPPGAGASGQVGDNTPGAQNKGLGDFDIDLDLDDD